jgi:hypothetical protein
MTTVEVDMLTWALQYRALGLWVVPLHTPREDGSCDCPKGVECGRNSGKHPRTMHGLDDATTDEEKIRRWWGMWPHANIGIDLVRSGLVDIAPDSIEWFAEFTARGLPETLRFASGGGNGHEHWLYRRSPECPAYRLTETGQYDVLSAGYAVAPPSLHRSQRRYAWINPPEVEQLLAGPTVTEPKWARDMLQAKARPRTNGSASTPTTWTPGEPPVVLEGEALERWHGRVYDINPETGGIDRSYSLWSLSVILLEAGCAPLFVQSVLAERDFALGWSKFTERGDAYERYSTIVERAAAGQASKPITLNGTAKAQPKPKQTPPLALRWMNIDEFNASEDEDVAWTCLGFIGDGLITELDGKAKRSGKTTMLLSLAYCIIHGWPFLGQPCTPTPVVYLTEQSGPSFKRSLRRSGLVDGDRFTLLLWGDTRGWTWEQLVPEALAKCEEVGAHVLIIDTLAQFSGVRGDDENRSGAALEVMEPLQAATTRPLGILISRHDRKAGGGVGDSGRGSSAYAGAVDIILHLDRPEPKPGNERQRVMEGIGRFEETPDSVLIELGEAEPQTYRLLGDVGEIKAHDLREEILAALPTDETDAVDREVLAQRVAGRALEISRIVNLLIGEGLVIRLGRGIKGDKYRYYQQPHGEDDDD